MSKLDVMGTVLSSLKVAPLNATLFRGHHCVSSLTWVRSVVCDGLLTPISMIDALISW